MRIEFASPGAVSSGACVVGVVAGRRLCPTAEELDGREVLTRAMAASPRFTGAEAQTLTVMAPEGLACSRVVLVGLGAVEDMDGRRARTLGGTIAALLSTSGETHADVALDLDDGRTMATGTDLLAELALGLRLRAHRTLSGYRTRHDPDEDTTPTLTTVTIRTDHPEALHLVWQKLAPVAEGVILARELTAEPANHLTPESFITRIRAMSDLGLTLEVLDENALARQGLGLLLAVGQGSRHRPRLAVVRWQGAEDPDEPPVVLIGKGITFDTGGLSLKHGESVHEMKGDMAGAATALGVLRGLAGRGANVNAAAVLPLAENMPDGGATRPGDVVRSYAGLTVEIVDTDAEGRLILADALAYARKTLRPRVMIDLATLTGAIITTLGRHHAGLFSPDDALAARLVALGTEVGERLWRMPLLGPEVDEDMRSDIADLKNASHERLVPDALDAARFLQRFVEPGDDTAGAPTPPWVHLDVAGVTENDEDTPLAPKGPTGFGVLLLDRLIGRYYEGG
ncbi:MAG: leucyl aminopeptidase [Alphaproteobacteria bacterium]